MSSDQFGPFPLGLSGWEHYSTWGYDFGMHCLYAQLYRNESGGTAAPDIWITPPRWPVIHDVEVLANLISRLTKRPLDEVIQAINDAGSSILRIHDRPVTG